MFILSSLESAYSGPISAKWTVLIGLMAEVLRAKINWKSAFCKGWVSIRLANNQWTLKSTMSFLTSLRRTSYVALKPQGGSKTQNGFFQPKSHFAWRKSATKFLCVKTVSDKVQVVTHSLAYLSVRKWLVGDVPFYVKIWRILTHSFAKRRFLIYFCW